MHFSFSPERYNESLKYKNDIKHDALIISNAYNNDKEQGLANLSHELVQGKDVGMKLMTFDFSYSSGIQYMMSIRNVRNEMIRVLQTENIPQSKEIIEKLNNDIVNQRNNDEVCYNDLSEKTRIGNQTDLREGYRNLLNEYPSDFSKEANRIPIQIDDEPSIEEFSPFIEEEELISKNLSRKEER